MKKNYIILSFVLLFTTLSSKAQVVNGNFEIVKPNFLPSNWGMNYTQAITFDPITGQSTGDNILYTWCIPSLVYASTESHTGQYAMEVSNAFNQTQNTVIPGEAMIFSDATQDTPGWNPGIPLNPTANIERLGFYYKFLAVGNDVAQAKMVLFDANGNEIGKTTVDIHGTDNQYHYIYSYIYHPYNITPAYMQISFNMAKAGSTPTFGSRLIIDNVITNAQSLALIENPINDAFRVYPTLVDSEINIVPSTQIEGTIDYKIINSQAQIVKQNTVTNSSDYIYTMDVTNLSSGIYFLEIESNFEKVIKKFIKR